MAFLTILGQGREARARAGHRGRESAANRTDLTTGRDPRVPACGRACVRMLFARSVVAIDKSPRRGMPSRHHHVRVGPGQLLVRAVSGV
jgi:hypothetical protein